MELNFLEHDDFDPQIESDFDSQKSLDRVRVSIPIKKKLYDDLAAIAVSEDMTKTTIYRIALAQFVRLYKEHGL